MHSGHFAASANANACAGFENVWDLRLLLAGSHGFCRTPSCCLLVSSPSHRPRSPPFTNHSLSVSISISSRGMIFQNAPINRLYCSSPQTEHIYEAGLARRQQPALCFSSHACFRTPTSTLLHWENKHPSRPKTRFL